MLVSAKSEHPKLTNSEIILEELQPMWSRYLNVTDRRTDRQLAVAIPRSAYSIVFVIHVSGLSETGGNLTSYNATPGYAPDYQHDRYYNVTDLQFNYSFDIVEIHNTDSETSSVDLNL